MLNMLKKFALWFICFGLSFLVQSWGWAEQGQAFLYINLAIVLIGICISIVVFVISGLVADFADCEAEANRFYFIFVRDIAAIASIAVLLAIELFATWEATKLFNVDFYTAYMIMTFGQCLCPVWSVPVSRQEKERWLTQNKKESRKRFLFVCKKKRVVAYSLMYWSTIPSTIEPFRVAPQRCSLSSLWHCHYISFKTTCQTYLIFARLVFKPLFSLFW